MVDVVAPLVAQLLQYQLQYLEVVVLLVTNDIDHVVELVLLEAAQRSTQILCHIYRCAIATQQQLLVQTVSLQVDPYRTILATVEYALVQTILHKALTQKIGLRLVIYLVEIDAQSLVCHIKSIVNPAIHGLPEVVYLLVLGLPLAQHLLCLKNDGGALLCLILAHATLYELLDLSLVVLVELDIVLTYQVVALHARRSGSLAIAVELPCEHRFADVNTSIVHQIYLDNVVTVSLQNLCHGVTQKVVADMTQVQGLVGVG